LWADAPDAAEGMAVDPDEAFGKGRCIQEGVFLFWSVECTAVEADAFTRLIGVVELRDICKRQGEDLPAGECGFTEFGASDDALTLAAEGL